MLTIRIHSNALREHNAVLVSEVINVLLIPLSLVETIAVHKAYVISSIAIPNPNFEIEFPPDTQYLLAM